MSLGEVGPTCAKRYCKQHKKTKHNMNREKHFMDAMSASRYEAPELEVVEISVERGFEASEGEFEGPTYGEEDVEW